MGTVIRWFLILLAPVMVYADAGIVSLRPLYTPETAVLNPALVDLWTSFGTTFRIEPDGEAGYQVILEGEKFATLHLVQLGGETVADIVFVQQQSLVPQLSVHYFARLRVEGNALQVDFFGGEELLEQIERTGSPRYERLSEDVLVLTASTAELRRFVLDCLKQPEVFAEPSTYERAGPVERAADLNTQSWQVVRGSGASAEAYAKALNQAEEAVRLVPDDPDYWNTLGAAQYRAGRFSEALAAITRAEQLRQEARPEDLAFRAMAQQQLGGIVEAKKVLGELQQMLGDSRNCGDQEELRLLREAEDRISPKKK